MPAARVFRRLLRAWIVALGPLACAPGCFLGGQGTDDRAECRWTKRALEDDQQVSPVLAFAPADVLAWASGTRSVRARWHEPPEGTGASSQPGPVAIELAIERARGSALEVLPGNDLCAAPHLQVPVTVSVTSADGQLDERWPGALTAVRSDFARATADVALDRLAGALQWRSTARNVRLAQVGLQVSITDEASSGNLGAVLEIRTENSASRIAGVSPGGGPLLTWPADSPCGSHLVARAPGAEDALYVEATARAAASTWIDPQGDEHTLVITAADQVCEPETGEPALPASIAWRSADGAVDLMLDAWFVRDGEQLAYDRSRERMLGAAPAAFVQRFGDFGLDLEGYEHVSIELAITLSAAGGQAELRIVGFRDGCLPNCPGGACAGCGPLTRIVLLERLLLQRP